MPPFSCQKHAHSFDVYKNNNEGPQMNANKRKWFEIVRVLLTCSKNAEK